MEFETNEALQNFKYNVCSNAYYDKQLGNKALKRSILLGLNKLKVS